MNKRMLELYSEAHVPSILIDPSNNMPVPWKEFSAEKFAELLIKEVLSVANRHGNIKPRKVREHFGVNDESK